MQYTDKSTMHSTSNNNKLNIIIHYRLYIRRAIFIINQPLNLKYQAYKTSTRTKIELNQIKTRFNKEILTLQIFIGQIEQKHDHRSTIDC